MQKKPYTIQVLGTSFTIQTDENTDYLEQLESLYKDKIRQIQASLPIDDPLKTSIIAGILLMDDLLKSRDRNQLGELVKAEELTLRMIQRIDTILDDETSSNQNT